MGDERRVLGPAQGRKGWWFLLTPIGLLLLVWLGVIAGTGNVGAAWPAQAPQATPVPHPVEGREDCLACHDVGELTPFPQDHVGRTNATCLMCHLAAAPPSPTPAPPDTAAATPSPSPIPPVGGPGPTLTPTSTVAPEPTPTLAPVLAGENCLACHGGHGLVMTFASGEVLELFVDVAVFEVSVHGDKLRCSACHPGHTAYPHPETQAQGRREYTLAQYVVCETCHFANYTKTLDSVHFTLLSQGNRDVPVCVDCHGAHDVAAVTEPIATISRSCARCHQAIYADYLGSVHGRALLEEGNADVPVCTDCHGTHDIGDPRTASFRLETPDLCARCHSNTTLMEKYGLSDRVLQTYLQDFHGVSLSFYRKESPGKWSDKAVCTDCHGVHDIASAKDPTASTVKANLLETCRQCHPGATENFPDAWLSHYEPSLSTAPLVYLVKVFYGVFIPFAVVGLSAHVLLDLWRVLRTRRKEARNGGWGSLSERH